MPRRNFKPPNTGPSTDLILARKAILGALIKEHLGTGEAVGSRVLLGSFLPMDSDGSFGKPFRNVMAELEGGGAGPKQPHHISGGGFCQPTRGTAITSITCLIRPTYLAADFEKQ